MVTSISFSTGKSDLPIPSPFVEVDNSASCGVPSAVLDVDDLGLKWLPEVLPWSQACN